MINPTQLYTARIVYMTVFSGVMLGALTGHSAKESKKDFYAKVQRDIDRRNGYGFNKMDKDFSIGPAFKPKKNPFRELQKRRDRLNRLYEAAHAQSLQRQENISGKSAVATTRLIKLRRDIEAVNYDIGMRYKKKITRYHNEIMKLNDRINACRAKSNSVNEGTTDKYQRMTEKLLKQRGGVIQKAVDNVIAFEALPKTKYVPDDWGKAWLKNVSKAVHSAKKGKVKKKEKKPKKEKVVKEKKSKKDKKGKKDKGKDKA